MTPAEEDALIERAWKENDSIYESDCITPLLRSAIRAAVAAERERCAKVCGELADNAALGRGDSAVPYIECQRAIREGEK